METEHTYPIFDSQAHPSVAQVVEALNAEELSCPGGLAIVRSEQQKLYFLLARDDKADALSPYIAQAETGEVSIKHATKASSPSHGLRMPLSGDHAEDPGITELDHPCARTIEPKSYPEQSCDRQQHASVQGPHSERGHDAQADLPHPSLISSVSAYVPDDLEGQQSIAQGRYKKRCTVGMPTIVALVTLVAAGVLYWTIKSNSGVPSPAPAPVIPFTPAPTSTNQPGWYASAVNGDCKKACESNGLVCKESDMLEYNGNVTNSDNLKKLIEHVHGRVGGKGRPCHGWYGSKPDVPSWKTGENGTGYCYLSDANRALSTINCSAPATPSSEGKQRLCYCSQPHLTDIVV